MFFFSGGGPEAGDAAGRHRALHGPEMIEGYYNEKVDIFSLGIILYQFSTSEHPFYIPQVDDEQSVHQKIVDPEPVLPPGPRCPGYWQATS